MDVDRLPLDQLDVITARLYAERGYPHAEWRRLRREDPVHWSAPPGYQPFWAITKHADIVEVSKQPDRFRSAGRFILFPEMTTGAGADARGSGRRSACSSTWTRPSTASTAGS